MCIVGLEKKKQKKKRKEKSRLNQFRLEKLNCKHRLSDSIITPNTNNLTPQKI